MPISRQLPGPSHHHGGSERGAIGLVDRQPQEDHRHEQRTYERVSAFARRHNISWSGALHELVRTHPLIGLPSLLAAQERIDALTGAVREVEA